jgi:hypothetical protein
MIRRLIFFQIISVQNFHLMIFKTERTTTATLVTKDSGTTSLRVEFQFRTISSNLILTRTQPLKAPCNDHIKFITSCTKNGHRVAMF